MCVSKIQKHSAPANNTIDTVIQTILHTNILCNLFILHGYKDLCFAFENK